MQQSILFSCLKKVQQKFNAEKLHRLRGTVESKSTQTKRIRIRGIEPRAAAIRKNLQLK